MHVHQPRATGRQAHANPPLTGGQVDWGWAVVINVVRDPAALPLVKEDKPLPPEAAAGGPERPSGHSTDTKAAAAAAATATVDPSGVYILDVLLCVAGRRPEDDPYAPPQPAPPSELSRAGP
jgi:hypothetical protein